MTKSFEISINPDVIKWARESAGFSVEEIAKKLKISTENYKKIEKGEKKPTFRQIENLSHFFKRPTAVFLLPKPPEEPSISTSFRVIPKSEKELSKEIRLAIRKARYYQEITNELMKELGLHPKAQVPEANISDNPFSLAKKQREKCGIPIEEQFRFKSAYTAFSKWREIVEAQNILVFQFNFSLESARGFSLMDNDPPAIVINSADNILARIFTLFHEYAHILLNMPEIYTEDINQYIEVENWCNRFASEFLVPEEELRKEPAYKKFIDRVASLEETLEILSNRFIVSKHAILTKFKALNLITQEDYNKKSAKLRERFREERKKSFYNLPSHKRCIQEKGKRFVFFVMDSQEKGMITSTDAMEYLSLKLEGLKELSKIQLRK